MGKLNKRLLNNSFRKVYRNRHIIALRLGLNDKEFRLLDFLSDISDWDKTHLETYGTATFTVRDVAIVLNWSYPVVSKTVSRLVNKNLLEKKNISQYVVHELSDFRDDVSLTTLDVSPHKQIVSVKKQNYSKNITSSIVSYKDRYSSINPTTIQTSKKSQKIVDDAYETIDISDIKWINKHVKF